MAQHTAMLSHATSPTPSLETATTVDTATATGDVVLLYPITGERRSRHQSLSGRNAGHAQEREANPLVRKRTHIHLLSYALDQPLLKAFIEHLNAIGDKEPNPVRFALALGCDMLLTNVYQFVLSTAFIDCHSAVQIPLLRHKR